MASKKVLTASFVKDGAVPSPSLHEGLESHSVGSIFALRPAFLGHSLAWEGLSPQGHARCTKTLLRFLALGELSLGL